MDKDFRPKVDEPADDGLAPLADYRHLQAGDAQPSMTFEVQHAIPYVVEMGFDGDD